jgi:hypothetical protein
MQDAGEDGALDGKLKTAAREQLAQHRGNAESLPEPPEQERPTNARAGARGPLPVPLQTT